MSPGAQAALITLTALSLLLTTGVVAIWRVDTRAWRRLTLRQRALIGRLRHRVVDLRQARDEWIAEAGRLDTWGRDLYDRLGAAEHRAAGYLTQLDALTVGQPTADQVAEAALAGGDVLPDDGGWQMARDVLADIRRLPETEGPPR